jgi:ParB family chromosome partitioning protein
MTKRVKASETLDLAKYDDLFTAGSDDKDVLQLPVSELHEFKGHPFKVFDDEKMDELVESIKKNGVLLPVIVRKMESGGYEIISGHRRTTAAKKAGLTEIPAVIRNYNDDEATIIMVDSNIQREELLPSEKAFAYKMKADALNHQGKKQVSVESREKIAEDSGENVRNVSRYIRLTYLNDSLLALVDMKKIGFIPAVELSYLPAACQGMLFEVISENNVYPDLSQASQIRQLPIDKSYVAGLVKILINKKVTRKVSINEKKISSYFPESYSNDDIEKTIFRLLHDWSKENGYLNDPAGESAAGFLNVQDKYLKEEIMEFTDSCKLADFLKKQFGDNHSGASRENLDYEASPKGIEVTIDKVTTRLTWMQLAVKILGQK